MTHAARIRHARDIDQELAVVTRVEEGSFEVQGDGVSYRARRAVGCLVAPEAGDRVLVAVAAREAWVLTVLDREAGAATRLTADGDLELSLPHGRLAITAAEGVEVTSGAPVSVVATAVRVHAGEGELSVQRMDVIAGVVSVGAETLKVVAGALDQSLDRFTQRVKRAYRFVEEFDQLRAGRIDYVARQLLELRGETTAVTAETLVKVDGAQVHVG